MPDDVEEPNIFRARCLLAQYSAMASDAVRKQEAEEWSEGLIGEAFAEAYTSVSQMPEC